jgi:hypothetical protein
MQPILRKRLPSVLFTLLASCGGYENKNSSSKEKNSMAADRPASHFKASSTGDQSEKALNPSLDFPFREAQNSEGAKCQLVRISSGAAVMPKHCLAASTYITEVVSKDAYKILGEVSPLLVVTEPFVILQKMTHSSPKKSIAFSEIQIHDFLPLPYRISVNYEKNGLSKANFCYVADFEKIGKISYRCDTFPGQSGALIKDREGAPFAIHLGIRGGLGYGVLLSVLSKDVDTLLQGLQENKTP